MGGKFSPDDSLTRVQQLMGEAFIEDTLEFINTTLQELANEDPSIKKAFGEAAMSIPIEPFIDTGSQALNAYWQAACEASLSSIQEMRKRIYALQEEVDAEAFPLFLLFKLKLSASEDDWWSRTADLLAFCLGYPLQNRLMLLSIAEHHIWMTGELPDISYEDLLTELESYIQRGRGRRPDLELRQRRKEIVVQAVKNDYDSMNDFYCQLCLMDDDWQKEPDAKTPQNYFRYWLKDNMPSSIEEWRSIATWWEKEIKYGVDTGYIPGKE